MRELVIRSKGGAPAAALTEGGKLIAYFPLEEAARPAPEALYLGRAGRVLKNLEALFVSLPEGMSGYLPFDEIPDGHRPRGGEDFLVQVKKPPQGNKSAFLTADIALPGRRAVLLPRGNAAHATSRLSGEEKAGLAGLAARLKPPGMGLVLREAARGVPEADLREEIAALKAQWETVAEKARHLSAPALVMPPPAPIERILREQRTLPVRVLSDDPKLAESLGIPAEESGDPFALYSITHQLRQALKRRVYLPSGGTLVIDPCEAGTVMDVNTGKNSLKGQDIILRTNLEAAREAARLIRLRSLGGMILIDFIDMKSDEERLRVREALEEALEDDPVKTAVHGFTRLGILEMTRRKADGALPAQTLSPCPACGGTGYPGLLQEEDSAHAR